MSATIQKSGCKRKIPEILKRAKLFTALFTGYRLRQQEFARGGG
jgi:hypothetical protein